MRIRDPNRLLGLPARLRQAQAVIFKPGTGQAGQAGRLKCTGYLPVIFLLTFDKYFIPNSKVWLSVFSLKYICRYRIKNDSSHIDWIYQ